MTNAVLITGAAKRVGAALALHFAQHGYDVALHYHRARAEAEQLKTDIEKLGQRCATFSHDLIDCAGIPAFMAQVQQAMPHCTALINSASLFERAGFMETDEALYDQQFAVNCKAPFFLTQAFAKCFGRGCVINMLDSEITGNNGSHFAYLLTKKALADFTQMAARAVAPAIRVNAVCPGIIEPANAGDVQYQEKLAQRLPLQATASVAQVCAAAFYLCSNPALTGQCLYIDGGQHLL